MVMRILDPVHTSGNGHIARGREIQPFLVRYGAPDVFLSGNQHDPGLNRVPHRESASFTSLRYLHFLVRPTAP
ncbi:MAG TPA: hypothetical protein VMV20_04890 [Chitinophagaceae bacterium]|nr:hypothetical protein [Chitinophagaceae bacterium]